MIGKLLKMQLLEDDDELAYTPTEDTETTAAHDGRPAWMRTLHNSLATWMQLIPQVREGALCCTLAEWSLTLVW